LDESSLETSRLSAHNAELESQLAGKSQEAESEQARLKSEVKRLTDEAKSLQE